MTDLSAGGSRSGCRSSERKAKMKRKWLLSALAASLMGGCAVYPAYDPYDEIVVYSAPPPVYYEHVDNPPVVDAIWITGYWNWVGTRYVWVPGRWESPRPGFRWMPHRWEREGSHWRQYGGRWEREARPRPETAPPPRGERHEGARPEPRSHVQPAPKQPPAQERQVAPRNDRERRPPPSDGSRPRVEPRAEPREAPSFRGGRVLQAEPEERGSGESGGNTIEFRRWRR